MSAENQPPSLSNEEIVQLAWSEKVTFSQLQKASGLNKNEVIELMRKELNANSFRNWKKKNLEQQESVYKKFKKKNQSPGKR